MSSLFHTVVSPLKGERNYTAVVFVGAIVFVLLVTTGFMATRKARKSSKAVKIKDRYKATVRSFDSFFSDLLPFTFRYETVSTVFRRKLWEEHDFTRFGHYPGSPGQTKSERVQAWLLLLLKLLIIFSCNVAMAILYYPANHDCDHHTTAEGCTNSIRVEIIGSLCSWDAQSNTCHTAPTSEKFGFTLTQLFATLFATTLLDKFFKFTISHAVVAIKSRRLSWLYGCCLPAAPGEVFLPELRGVRNVRVAPAPVWERGRFTLGMPDTALATKPTSSKNTSTSSNPGKIYLAEGKEEQDYSGQDATLSMALEAAESGLEHFGDEWKALAVQSRKST